MSDKSPRQHLSTKSIKTLKQKRTERRELDTEPAIRKPPRPRGAGGSAGDDRR